MRPAQRPEVVVITGASAGVGRATAQAFARRGALIGLLARGREGLEAAHRDVETRGGHAIALPTDVADFEQVDAAAAAVEDAFGPIDIWVNNAMVSVFSPVKAHETGRVPPRHRGDLPGHRPRHPGSAFADAAARPRRDRSGRLGAGLPGHPAPVGLLRGQARDPGVLRLSPLRADPRQEPRPPDDGADARAEHTSVLLGQEPAAQEGTAGAADLPARGRGRIHRLGRPSQPALVDGRLAHRRGDHRQQDRPGLARRLPRQHLLRRPDDRRARGSGPPR